MWHLNLSYLKLSAKLYLAKKKYEELKRQYELEKQKRAQLRDYVKDLPVLPADSSLNDIILRIEDVVKHINNPNMKFYKDAVKTKYNSDGSIQNKYYNEYKGSTFEVQVGSNKVDCKEGNKISLNQYIYNKNEDNYKYSYEILIHDYWDCDCNPTAWYLNSIIDNMYYNLQNRIYKYYKYNENYRYDNLSYPILKALMYPNHLLRRVNVGKKYLTLHFDSGHKVYIYYADKNHYCYFNSLEYLDVGKDLYHEVRINHMYEDKDTGKCNIASDLYRQIFYHTNTQLSISGNSKYSYLAFNFINDIVYLFISRYFRLGNVSSSTVPSEYKSTGKELEIRQFISFYYNVKTNEIRSLDVSSYLYSKLYKDWHTYYTQRNIPLDVYISGKKQLIVPFDLSTYKQKQSVINPLQPDNPRVEVEDITKAVSLDDFVDAVKGVELGSRGLKKAFIKELLIEFATLTYGYGYELKDLNDMLYYLAGLTYLPLNIGYWLAKNTYETLFYLKQNDYQIEVYDF
jgi:hypothetical protein